MDMKIDEQVALDEALVPHESRLRIGKSNFCFRSDITSKESTLQLLKRIVNLEYFREMLHICPGLFGQIFDELPFEEKIMAFLRFLGHSGEIRKLTDVNINKLHQPWRSFAAIINKCLSGKSIGYDSLRFTKVIIHYFMTKDPSIPRRNKFGVMLPVELTNKDIKNSEAYKEYYAVASGATPPKTKASVRKMKSSFDTTITPLTAAGIKLSTSAKGKQHDKAFKAKSLTVLSEIAMTEAEQMKLATKRSLQQTHISQASGSDADEGTSIKPRVPDVPTKESDEDDDDEVDERSDDQDTNNDVMNSYIPSYPFMKKKKLKMRKALIPSFKHLKTRMMKEQVKDQVKVQVSNILSKIEKTVNEQLEAKVHTRSSNSSKTSYAVAADLSEMELKKILIKKMERNKSIHRSDKHRNLYKALVEAYDSNKIILDTYGDTVTLKRRRDDADKMKNPMLDQTEGARGEEKEKSQSQQELQRRKQPRPLTSLLKGLNLIKRLQASVADDQPITEASQHPECDLAKQADSRSSVNELMDTPVDFSTFLMNRLKVETLTPELLGISHWGRKRQQFYRFIVNRESARDVNSKRRIIAVTELQFVKWHNYKHLDWITVRRDDDKLYKFKEGDFKRLHIQDIEYMLLVLVQRKLTNLTVEEQFAFNDSLKMFTRSIVIQRRMEDLQLDKQNMLMRIDELHKFSDGTPNDVQTALDGHLKGIRIKYLPHAICRKSDKERAAMIQAIDKQLKTR
nr:hypothetical protein [Tanacetum cinerariifolium]